MARRKIKKRGRKSGKGPKRPGSGGKARRDTIDSIVDGAQTGTKTKTQRIR